MISSEKRKTNLFLLTFEIRIIRHQDSGTIDWRDQFMDQEWYCTGNAIAQIMIVFIISIFDELKTQIYYFINVAVTRFFFFYDNMPASALHKGGHFCR